MLNCRSVQAYNKVPSFSNLARYTNASRDAKSVQVPNPKKITTDMIGPADPVSNLRKVIFREPTDESNIEKRYRELRLAVQEWNHNFWSQHNSRFFQEREKYLKENLPEGRQNLTADEMSVFYKSFLDKNWKIHIAYNKEWYKKNLSLLRYSIQVKLIRLFKIKG